MALATAYARVVLAFLRDDTPDTDDEPLHILELGAGSGRFAFLFLTVLTALERRAGVPALPIRYVMTDATDATIRFWRRHEAFAPFVRAGRLDFARFDAETGGALRLRHARRTIAPARAARRLVVIANYVFDGLRHDAFVLRRGRLHDYLAAAAVPARGRAADVSMAWRVGPRVAAPYPEDDVQRDPPGLREGSGRRPRRLPRLGLAVPRSSRGARTPTTCSCSPPTAAPWMRPTPSRARSTSSSHATAASRCR